MEKSAFKVLDVFTTSVGVIVILDGINDRSLFIRGMILSNVNSSWRILGVGMGKKPIFIEGVVFFEELIIDCKIVNISGDDKVKKGDIFYLD